MMGIELTNVPDHFLEKLPAEERKRLGRAGMTREEAEVRYIARSERELQKVVWEFLKAQKIYFVQPRMDKKTTVAKGTPDFVCSVEGAFVAIECKCASTKGKLSKEQEAVMGEVITSGGIYLVIYDLEDLRKALPRVQSA